MGLLRLILGVVVVMVVSILCYFLLYTYKSFAGGQAILENQNANHVSRTLLLEHPEKLIGKTPAEISHQLGPPDQIGRMGGDDLSYYLGPEDGYISIDTKWVVIKFRNGKASEVLVNTD